MLQHGDRIQLAYSTVTHVIASNNWTLTKLTPATSSEETEGIEKGSGDSIDPAFTRGPGTVDGHRRDGLDNIRDGLESHPASDIYEGTVRLNVGIEGQVRLVVSFVTELRLNPRLRLLRLVGNPPENVAIWVALREPTPLKQVLAKMEEVAEVSGSPGTLSTQASHEDILDVRLNTVFLRDYFTHRFEKKI